MTKKQVGVVTVIAVVGALGFVSFKVGLLAGAAHKTIEKRLSFNKGFEKGKSCKIGALGVPLGTKCVVFGWLDRPSPPLKKRDDADNVFYLKVESVNGKECMATLRVLLDKDEATRFCGQYEFVGYETIMAEGVPAWLNEGEVSTMDYFVEHYFVITDSPRNGTANRKERPMKPLARMTCQAVALRRLILVSSFALALAGAYADWSDAGWFVSTYGAEKNVFKVINTNKMSFRVYAFNRLTGALKYIRWNTSKVEEFYINGESEVLLTIGGKKAKLDFVSVTENEDRGLHYLDPPKNRKGSDVLATVESLFAVPSEDTRIFVTYRFRRDNEVRVDCAVIAKRPLAGDSRLSVAYPINRDYTKIVKNPKSSDEVQNVKLYRDCDKGPTLIFAARSRKGDEELRKGIFGAIFSSAPKARMEINLSSKANPLSPTHDRMLTLSAPLRDPETQDDGTLRYTFNFTIPLYEKD